MTKQKQGPLNKCFWGLVLILNILRSWILIHRSQKYWEMCFIFEDIGFNLLGTSTSSVMKAKQAHNSWNHWKMRYAILGIAHAIPCLFPHLSSPIHTSAVPVAVQDWAKPCLRYIVSTWMTPSTDVWHTWLLLCSLVADSWLLWASEQDLLSP